jgi:hypothetical protein
LKSIEVLAPTLGQRVAKKLKRSRATNVDFLARV